jgi:hypothetical protein
MPKLDVLQKCRIKDTLWREYNIDADRLEEKDLPIFKMVRLRIAGF